MMPEEVYEQIKKEIPYQVGVYVPDGMNYRGEWYDLKADVYKRQPGWKKVRCPECGTLCWQRPEDAGVVKASHLDGAVCTKCALRKAGEQVERTAKDFELLYELMTVSYTHLDVYKRQGQ